MMNLLRGERSRALTSVEADCVASAYEAAILFISEGVLDRFPDRATRQRLLVAITDEGQANGSRMEPMRDAAILAVSQAGASTSMPGEVSR